MHSTIFYMLKMKKDIKYAAAVESEAQTLETDKAASTAHDVQQVLLWVISVMLVIVRSDIRMSYGTSDSTVISSSKPEAHNLHSTNASAAPRDGPSSGVLHDNTPENL